MIYYLCSSTCQKLCAVIATSGWYNALFWIQHRVKVSDNFQKQSTVKWHDYFVQVWFKRVCV